MDLVRGITNLTTAKTLGDIQIAVAKKVLDAQKQQGDAALQLLASASGGVAQAGDQLTAAALGLGGSLDTYG